MFHLTYELPALVNVTVATGKFLFKIPTFAVKCCFSLLSLMKSIRLLKRVSEVLFVVDLWDVVASAQQTQS